MARSRSEVDFTGLLLPIVSSTRQPQQQNDDVIIRFKPGGFPDDMFCGLPEDERRKYECNICFLVVKDPRQCVNAHLFCATCIFTWTLSSSAANRDKCPVCRSPGRYRPDLKTESRLNRKRVVCRERACAWKGSLSGFRRHYKTVHSDSVESLLPPVILPTMTHGYLRLDSDSGEESLWRVVRDPPPAEGPRGGATEATRGRRRLRHLFEAFGAELDQRRQNIDEHYRLREACRVHRLSEVESLGRRLDDVSADLDRLMSDMTRDSDRYRDYIRSSIDMEDSLLALSHGLPDSARSSAGHVMSRRWTPDMDRNIGAEVSSLRSRGASPQVDSRRRRTRNGGHDKDTHGSGDRSVSPPLIDRSDVVNGEPPAPVYRLLADQRANGRRTIRDDRSVNYRTTLTRGLHPPRHNNLVTSSMTRRQMLPPRLHSGLNPEITSDREQSESQGQRNGSTNQRIANEDTS